VGSLSLATRSESTVPLMKVVFTLFRESNDCHPQLDREAQIG
jgi:hypothetical protein